MHEAMSAFISYLADDLSILSLQATIDTENIASIKLIEKLGFSANEQSAEEIKENLISYTKNLTT